MIFWGIVNCNEEKIHSCYKQDNWQDEPSGGGEGWTLGAISEFLEPLGAVDTNNSSYLFPIIV